MHGVEDHLPVGDLPGAGHGHDVDNVVVFDLAVQLVLGPQLRQTRLLVQHEHLQNSDNSQQLDSAYNFSI